MYLKNYEIQELAGTIEEFITEKTCSALSTLLNEPISHQISIPENRKSDKAEVSFPSNEIKLCSVRLNGKGDLHIELLYTIKLEHALNIASKLLGTKIQELDEMGMSALQEVANILTGSFFNALSENTGYRIDLSTPSFKEGKLKDLIKEPTKDVDSCPNDVIITDISLSGENTKTEIHMIIIQHPDHAKKLISSKNEILNVEDYESKSNTNLLGGKNDSIDELIGDYVSIEKISGEP
ncbi:chemotaxis protein CheC [Nitrosopumilus sp. b3]|uniref:chemotaxis protein CheC n=1 Tax=Nitrosopumilus sp. b3 TaxID=2109909 RepID=UPI0015F65007|nr:chemotaxis protein CheC [Nitrosopumilus sp. b3]KAF6247057.1 chemotaxis protein CheC [Nitrosopumilus sp. b3]